MSSPLISIVMIAYNEERRVRGCIDSLTAQTCREIEILCVDDGSTDGTAAVMDDAAHDDPRVRVIRQGTNRGMAAGRHAGFKAAAGQYILFVDADDALVPQTCERLLAEMREQPADVLDFGLFLVPDSQSPPTQEALEGL